MSEHPEKAYCISCGEQVPVKVTSIGIQGEELLQCVHCLSFLGTKNKPQTLSSPGLGPVPSAPASEPPGEFRPDESTTGGALMPDLPPAMDTPVEAGGELLSETGESAPGRRPAGPPLETVFTVEDSSLILTLLNDMIVEQGFTRRVIPCKNGYEFLGRYVRERLTPSRVGLVIMDVKMPVLNGISSAVAMRAHEKALGLSEIPILFFTSKRCDEIFRKVLIRCAPAMYINKGASTSPDHLKQRITKVIRQLKREEW